MNITLDAGDFAQLAEAWKRAPDITRTRLMQAATASDAKIAATLKQNLPKGAGGAAGLAGSVQTEEQALDDNVIGMVFTALPYAVPVELGTRPHLPPLQPLLDWVKVKFGIFDIAAQQIAEKIRWSIFHHGTKANPVWQRTWDAEQDYVLDQYDQAIDAIMRDLAGASA